MATLGKAQYSQEEVEELLRKVVKQNREFQARILQNLPVLDQDVQQGWIDNPKALQDFLKGLAPSTTSKTEKLDTIVRVDRNIRPVYPDWVKLVMHPELENVGPAEYDLATTNLWLHDVQKDGGIIKGQKIYEHLKEKEMLAGCFGLHDAVAIKEKGIAVFRKFFKSKVVFCWKSVVQRRDGSLRVPDFYEDGGRVVVRWNWLEFDWVGGYPAGRLANHFISLQT